MNIYLDIDGVLLVNENSAANFADEFLVAVLSKYPNSTFWLTTHCWKGENRAVAVLSPHLKPETVALLSKIKPTEWRDWKTDAIDFSKPFLWFDDDLFPKEKAVLEKNNVLKNYVAIDLYQNPTQLKDLVKLL